MSANEKHLACTRTKRRSLQTYIASTVAFNNLAISKYDTQYSTATHEFTHLMHGHLLLYKIILDEALKIPETWEKCEELLKIQKTELENQNLFENLTNQQREYRIKQENLLIAELDLIDAKERLYSTSKENASLIAAFEKTADTYVSCKDQQAAKNAVLCIKSLKDAQKCAYPDNYNDMQVIYANWQTSQAISDFQKFKNSTKQKISDFPQSLRTMFKA